MSLLEDEFSRLGKEVAKRIEGLRKAAGRIHELETLAETINAKLPELMQVAPCVSAHDDGSVSTWIHCWRGHACLRAVLGACDLHIESEVDLGKDSLGRHKTSITLAGIGPDITIEMYDEQIDLPAAA